MVKWFMKMLIQTTFQSFRRTLSRIYGKSSIPPNPSTLATGKANFTVTDGGKKMLYSAMKINHVDNAVLADGGKKMLYSAMKINHVDNAVLVFSRGPGLPASNLVLLRTRANYGATGPINGVMLQGDISSSSLVGPQKEKEISGLVKDMLDGHIDLWVTTTIGLMIAGKITRAGAV